MIWIWVDRSTDRFSSPWLRILWILNSGRRSIGVGSHRAANRTLKARGVAIRREDNASQLHDLEARLPKRLPPSFESLLLRYSFPVFDASGISFFGWGAASTEFVEIASAAKGSLSELLLPAGYFQIGRPDTGSFDAICFDLNTRAQNREYRIVLADHEQILSNSQVKIRSELWPSLREFLKVASSPD
jgi:hypothetical protein